MMGPNTASGHGSVSYITECHINYTLRVIKPVLKALRAQRSGLPALQQATDVVSVKPDAEQRDIDDVQERARDMVWSSGCSSWALDETTKRNTTMYPDFQYKYWLRSVFVAWNDSLGLGVFPGFAGGSLVGGLSYVMSTVAAKEQTRDSSETALMKRALGLPNYSAYVMTQGKQITFSPGKRAAGVWVDALGLRHHLTARQEVIVSAGTSASPQVLMVSGAGPAETLGRFNISVVAISSWLGYQDTSGSDPNDGRKYATMGAAPCMPRSRGSITISSSDNAVQPVVNPNFFADPADVEVAVIERIIKQSFQTIFHVASTCSMGKSTDKMAVVDNHARVFGVSGLRVVDASIFPILPPGHPMSTVCTLTFLPTLT
ncbi:hypothetical protein MY1884_004490 [Beauveria asiatica]